jgi:hypothetical protein
MKKAADCYLEGLRLARLQAALEATEDLIRNPAPIPMRSVARGLFEAKVSAKSVKGAGKVTRAVNELGRTLWDRSGAVKKKRVKLFKVAIEATHKLQAKAWKRCGV